MKHFITILFFLFSTQIFCQDLSEKLELAYQNNSQKQLKRVLNELALNDLAEITIPDSLLEFYKIYDVLIDQNDKYCFIQTKLIYSYVETSTIELFLSTENILFDTINIFTPIINFERPKLISLDDKTIIAFGNFINAEGIDIGTLSLETKGVIDKSLEEGSLLENPNDKSLLIINATKKTIRREQLSRQIASHKRLDFLQKQMSLSVGDVNQGVWEFEIIKIPNIRYIVIDYQRRKAWVLNEDCLTEMILIKNNNNKWVIEQSMNTGCL